MNESEENFNDDDGDEVLRADSEESLDTLLRCMIDKFDAPAKRKLISLLSEILGLEDLKDPLGAGSAQVVVDLSSECRFRVENLLETADMVFTRTLNKKQKELYNYLARIRLFSQNALTGKEYIELLNLCSGLARSMGLPFSIEEQYDGLKTWDEWNAGIEKAIKEGRERFGPKRKKK